MKRNVDLDDNSYGYQFNKPLTDHNMVARSELLENENDYKPLILDSASGVGKT